MKLVAGSPEVQALLRQASKRQKRQGPKDWADHLLFQIRARRLPLPVREHVFHPVRKWRLDLAWVDRMLFVECDGGEFVTGAKGKHGGARGRVIVPRATRGTLLKPCTRCRQRPRRSARQRWCWVCHRESMQTYRAAQADKARAQAWELAALRRRVTDSSREIR